MANMRAHPAPLKLSAKRKHETSNKECNSEIEEDNRK